MKNIFIVAIMLIFCWHNAKAQTVYSQPITGIKQHLGATATVMLTIDLAAGHSAIIKPLIVAEGFDLGAVFSPENTRGMNTYEETFRTSLQFSNSTELRNLIYENNKQYDIIYVDWNNGSDYLQRNAYALEEVINWVNEEKAKVGSTEPNVILGQSMGGVIARYALADMEQTGLNHQTRLFISHDAPQQGANIPVSLQFMYRHLNNQYVKSPALLAGGEIIVPIFTDVQPVSNYLSILDLPASKQLLSNSSTSNYNIDNFEHNTFYNELKAKGLPNSGGYPINCRNIAISNGAECGLGQGFNPGDNLVNYNWNKGLTFGGDLLSMIYLPLGGMIGGQILDSNFYGVAVTGLIPGKSKFNVEFNAKAMPYGTSNQIYKGRISYSKKILWIGPTIVVNITHVQKNQPSGILPLDTYGGGFYDTSIVAGSLTVPNLYVRDKFNFIPTTSALDIGKRNLILQDADYKRAYVGATPPVAPKNSPFVNFSSDFEVNNPNSSNKSHISFNSRNGQWFARELNLNPIVTNCSYMCSSFRILGENSFCTATNYSASASGATTFDWTVTQGASLVSLTGSGTPNVTLTVLPNASGTITLSLKAGGTCGNVTVTKIIQVGTRIINTGVVAGASTVNFNETLNYSYGGEGLSHFEVYYNWFIYGGLNEGSNGLEGPEGGAYIVDGQGTPYIALETGSNPGYIVVEVVATTYCDLIDTAYLFVDVTNPFARASSLTRASTITIFPNPLTNLSTLQLTIITTNANDLGKYNTKIPSKSGDNHIKIYDFYGNLKHSASFKNNQVSLNSLNLERGKYVLNVTTSSGEQLKTILLVQ